MENLARVNTNIAALQAYRTLMNINARIISSAERIATGKIYNRSSQGPANYYISKVLERKINRFNAQSSAIDRGISWLQTNDSNYAQVADILSEMSDLVESAKAGGITSAEKDAIQIQLNGLKDEIGDILQSGIDSRITAGTSTAGSGFSIGNMSDLKLTGAGNSNRPTYSVVVEGDLASINVTGTAEQIESSLTSIETAMDRVLLAEGTMGTWIKRLEFQSAQAQTESTNTTAILSSVNDADLAKEQLELTKLQILQSTAQSMMTQLNTSAALILKLFS